MIPYSLLPNFVVYHHLEDLLQVYVETPVKADLIPTHVKKWLDGLTIQREARDAVAWVCMVLLELDYRFLRHRYTCWPLMFGTCRIPRIIAREAPDGVDMTHLSHLITSWLSKHGLEGNRQVAEVCVVVLVMHTIYSSYA